MLLFNNIGEEAPEAGAGREVEGGIYNVYTCKYVK
jgi:hypothetical protein